MTNADIYIYIYIYKDILCMDKSFNDTRSGDTKESPLRSYDKSMVVAINDASRSMIETEETTVELLKV